MKVNRKVWIAALVALVMVMIGLALLRQGQAVRELLAVQDELRATGQRVEGAVASIDEVPDTRDGLGGATYDVTYGYAITDAVYSGRARFPGRPPYAVGDTVAVWVDPQVPARHAAELPGSTATRTAKQARMLLIGGVASLLAGVLFLVFEVARQRRGE
jgi:hypothetical protein